MITLAFAVALSVAPLDCPEGTVPGWLDEAGNPTSCVGDLPDPGAEPTTEPTPEPEPTEAPEPEQGIGEPDSVTATPAAPIQPVTKADPPKKLAVTGADDVPWWLPMAAGASILLGASLLLAPKKEKNA